MHAIYYRAKQLWCRHRDSDILHIRYQLDGLVQERQELHFFALTRQTDFILADIPNCTWKNMDSYDKPLQHSLCFNPPNLIEFKIA